ncbi:hypothetical protein AAH979_06420 [Plantactinospora sp. ZYX-F-223]|uniref:hypothetical protein n=1 Tax=Plantactinospora sp. ZYX-F-223 TaxID=3144103 RepID=UPI0031FDAD83
MTVKEVIGVWVVAQDTVPDTLELAQGTCSKKHKDLLSSVGAIDDGSRDEASDEPGETLFFGLLNCIGAAGINLERDTALFDSSASPAATAQFEDCIAKLRSFSSSTEPVLATDPPAAPLGV